MPKCPQCGLEVAVGKAVCDNCGEKIGNVQAKPQTQRTISVITDDDLSTSKSADVSDRPIGGIISAVTSTIGLILIVIFISLGMHHTGEEGWQTSTILFMFISMACAITGIMSGVLGLNHPKKLLSIIGLVFGGIFVAILGYVIASSIK
ncbi:MAG: hypothetical protein WBN66_13825 [Smithella sp.]